MKKMPRYLVHPLWQDIDIDIIVSKQVGVIPRNAARLEIQDHVRIVVRVISLVRSRIPNENVYR